jgi:cobalt/nickel transport system ATP-binding protein
MTRPLLSLERLSFTYSDRAVLSNVNFDLHPGERVAILGANGAGKTTLLELMVGLNKPTSGQIVAFGKPRSCERDFREVRARAGLLFQDSDNQLFCPTVLEDVVFGPLNLGRSGQEALAVAHRTLEELGISKFAERITHKLSGGEKRLVALATVLAMEPEVLLLDEPTTGLDEETEQLLMDHLLRLPQAMVFISHDAAFVERLATRAVILKKGKLVDSVLHRHPHVHAHTHVHVHPADDEPAHEHQEHLGQHEDNLPLPGPDKVRTKLIHTDPARPSGKHTQTNDE